MTDRQGKNRQSFGPYIFCHQFYFQEHVQCSCISRNQIFFFPRQKHRVQTNVTQTIQAKDFPYLERRPYLNSRNIACFLSGSRSSDPNSGSLAQENNQKYRKIFTHRDVITVLLFIYNNNESESKVAQSCPTLCNPVDYSLPGSSIHGILQARILEWVAISFSRGSSRPRDQPRVSHIVVRGFTLWAMGIS